MKLDLHFHTEYSYQGEVGHKESDSCIAMSDVPAMARQRGLDGIVITDHMTVEAGREEFQKVQEKNKDILLLRGMEYHSDHGHLLLYGIKDDEVSRIFGMYGPAQPVINFVNGQGGAAVPSHVYKIGYKFALCDRVFQLKDLAALEVLNGNLPEEVNAWAQQAAEKLHLPGTGGSDAHVPDISAGSLGVHRNTHTVFPKRVQDIASLVAALRKDRVYAAEDISDPLLRSVFRKYFKSLFLSSRKW